ncbi:transposase family protein [Streptomyces goshikiensis]|uniref:transposase family protein n=1 Tax=Streptomyces goshikiensis TaxID=1942 RepID=UPI00369D92F3
MLDTIAIRDELVTVQAAATTGRAECPACGTTSTRVPSRYVRRLDDTPAGQCRVVIELQVRRFRCRQ